MLDMTPVRLRIKLVRHGPRQAKDKVCQTWPPSGYGLGLLDIASVRVRLGLLDIAPVRLRIRLVRHSQVTLLDITPVRLRIRLVRHSPRQVTD